MTYEFGSSLYRNPREMCDAVAEQWLSAGGANDLADMLQFLNQMTDAQLADECIEGWGLNQPVDSDDPESPTWLAARDTDRDDLITAFQVLRDNLDERMMPKA